MQVLQWWVCSFKNHKPLTTAFCSKRLQSLKKGLLIFEQQEEKSPKSTLNTLTEILCKEDFTLLANIKCVYITAEFRSQTTKL